MNIAFIISQKCYGQIEPNIQTTRKCLWMIIGRVGKFISHSQKWNVYFPAVHNNGKAAYTDIQNMQTIPLCVNLKLVMQVI